MDVRIIDVDPAHTVHREQAAVLLYEAFRDRSTAWPSVAAARREVEDSLAPGRISRVAIDAAGAVIGWIGGQPHYEGHVWELHPLVVAPSCRRRGIGSALVEDLEARAAASGALTLWVGADDENFETSLGGADLYDDLASRLRNVECGGRHPLRFYERAGFHIVGVMPDANGPGKPDIYLARRVVPTAAERLRGAGEANP